MGFKARGARVQGVYVTIPDEAVEVHTYSCSHCLDAEGDLAHVICEKCAKWLTYGMSNVEAASSCHWCGEDIGDIEVDGADVMCCSCSISPVALMRRVVRWLQPENYNSNDPQFMVAHHGVAAALLSILEAEEKNEAMLTDPHPRTREAAEVLDQDAPR